MPVKQVPNIDPITQFRIDQLTAANPNENYIQKFGRNPDVDAATPEDVWDAGGLWVAPTAARIHDIVSTDANDAAAGTGAQTLFVEGLDANWDVQTEIVTLNGLTNVPTVESYLRIYRMIVVTAGTTGSNEGVLTATAQTDGTITAQVNTGNNQTLMAIYTVPNGKRATFQTLYGSIIRTQSTTAEFFLYFREDGSPWRVGFFFGIGSTGTGAWNHEFDPVAILEAKTDIRMLADVSAQNTEIAGGFSLTLYDYTAP